MRIWLLTLAVVCAVPATAQTWQWVTPGMNAPTSWGLAAVGDDVVASGRLQGTALFGALSLTASNGIYVVRYDASGEVVSGRAFSGSGTTFVTRAAPDGAGGVYISAQMQGSLTLGDTTVSSTGSGAALLVRLDADGQVLWARTVASTHSAWAYGVDAGPDGRVCITGGFQGTATVGTTTLNASGAARLFAACYTAGGVLLWARQSTGDGGFHSGEAIVVHADGVYVVADVEGAVSVANTPMPEGSPYGDVLVVAFGHDGSARWGVRSTEGAQWAGGIAANASGTVYATATASGPRATMGGLSVPLCCSRTPLVIRIAPDGQPSWLRTAGVWGDDTIYSVAVADDGTAFVSGEFAGQVTFGNTLLQSPGNNDLFIAALSADGDWLSGAQAGGQWGDGAQRLVRLASGDLAVTGYILPPATFGSLPAVTAGPQFVARLSGASVRAEPAPDATALLALAAPTPNPASGASSATLHLREAAHVRAVLVDALGRTVAVVHDGALAAGAHRLTLDAARLAPGAYVLRAEGGGAAASARLAVAR